MSSRHAVGHRAKAAVLMRSLRVAQCDFLCKATRQMMQGDVSLAANEYSRLTGGGNFLEIVVSRAGLKPATHADS